MKEKEQFEPFQPVLVRRHEYEKWKCDIFSHKDGDYFCGVGGSSWNYCIPYNDETRHFLGTKDSPNPFKWGDKVEVSDDGINWINAVYVTKNFANNHNAFGRYTGLSSYSYCRHADW